MINAVHYIPRCSLLNPDWHACTFQKGSSVLRLSVIFNSLSTTKVEKNSINRAVWLALNSLPGNIAKMLITKLVKEENAKGLIDGTKTLQDLEVNVSHRACLAFRYLYFLKDENMDN